MPTTMTLGGRWLALIALACLLVACQFPPGTDSRAHPGIRANPEKDRTFVYHCDDDLRFTARSNGRIVWLFLPGHAIQLARVDTALGEKYASRTATFSIDGQKALLELEGGSPLSCRNDSDQAAWEHAKLNGTDFRGTGNEPVWHLEITLGQDIVFVTRADGSTHRFTTPEPVVDPAARTSSYSAHQGKHWITIRLEGKRCIDSITGQQYEVAATVRLDGQQYDGCGRALH
jgi:uncharacterized membrane protein